MSEWTYVTKWSAVPVPGTWGNYEWEVLCGYEWNKIVADIPSGFSIHNNGKVTGANGLMYRYRNKPLPPDEWIEARLWFHNYGFVTAKSYPCSDKFYMNGFTDQICDRKWFLTAKWVLKDIKEGYTE